MDAIIKIIQQYPRHYSKMIQSDVVLNQWVSDHHQVAETASYAAKIYSALNQVTDQCPVGKTKKFNNIRQGFRFCGAASQCVCCRQSVQQRVSETKQQATSEQKQQTNQRRAATNLTKYGTVNTGQLLHARQSHAEFYQDATMVKQTQQQAAKTKLARYGSATYNNRAAAKATCQQKYQIHNPVMLTQKNQNPGLQVLHDPAQLGALYPRFGVEDIADQLGVHAQTVYKYLNLHGFREPYKSTFEKEIVFFLQSLGITNIVTNTRRLISKEIDIYLPDHNLAIEYNGVFWHHDQVPHITRTYHRDKFLECEAMGVTLFSIFGDSWATKSQIWRNKIRNRVRQSNCRVGARQARIVQLSAAETRSILDQYHVQGYCTAEICYGLEYQGQVIAVMTFSRPRAGIGKAHSLGTYELVRYVTSCSVPGGASRLLKHFICVHAPSKIYSYSDNRYSAGGLYRQLGFALVSENPCGYWYYDPVRKQSYHRYNYTKHKLVSAGHDPTKTEREITRELGLLRLYDCGTRTWELLI